MFQSSNCVVPEIKSIPHLLEEGIGKSRGWVSPKAKKFKGKYTLKLTWNFQRCVGS